MLRIDKLVDDGAHYCFHLAASHDNRNVGFNVRLLKGMKSGFDSNVDLIKEHVYRHGVRFLRSGEESDRLVSAIARLYGLDSPASTMVAAETYTAIALHQGDLDFDNQAVKLRRFFRSGPRAQIDQNAYY